MLPSCSGGGDGGTSAGGGGGAGDGARYHVFLDGLPGSATWKLVDPSSPGSPVTVAGSTGLPYEFNPVFAGVPEPGSAAIRDLQVDRLILADGDRVMALPLGLATGLPGLTEVKDLGGAVGEICLGTDLSTPNLTVHFAVEVGGAGGYQTFSQSGSTVTAAEPFPGTPVTFVGSVADGSFQGWVALETGMLTRVRPDLSVSNLAAATSATLIDVTDGGAAFFSLPTGFGCLRSDDSYMDVAFTPVAPGAFAPDEFAVGGESALYFASPTGASSFEIVKAQPDGTAAAITPDIMGEPTYLNVTPTRVLCAFDAGGAGVSLLSFDLDGADEQTLEAGASALELGLYTSPGIDSERIAYGVPGVGVVDILSDGSGRQLTADATIVGAEFARTLTFGNALAVRSIVLSTPSPAGGQALSSMSPGDPSSRVTLGTLPPGFTNVSASALFTPTAIVTAVDASQSDVYVLSLGAAGSLRRVTDTPARFELGVL